MKDRLTSNAEFDGNRYFWNAEDMVQRRKNYYLSVNLSSIRSNGPESVAPWSNVNYFMAQGAMMIKTRGNEYQETRGAMNFAALPGITSDPALALPNVEEWNGFPGGSDFCGGISNGKIGVCGFIYLPHYYKVAAKKGYFFMNDVLVALGADVSTGSIETTINQTAWGDKAQYGINGPVVTVNPGGVDLKQASSGISWFYNDGIGYLVLPGSRPAVTHLRAEKRVTRWAEIAKVNATRKDIAPTQIPVFQLSIAQVDGNDSYAYAVLPGTDPKAVAAAAMAPSFTVLSNTPMVQAVRSENDGTVQAIFYQAATLESGGLQVSVDRPAVIMLQHSGPNWTCYASDPLQQDPAGSLQLKVSGQTIQLKLPDKPVIGKTAEAHWTQPV